jgi:hypothetical protein
MDLLTSLPLAQLKAVTSLPEAHNGLGNMGCQATGMTLGGVKFFAAKLSL